MTHFQQTLHSASADRRLSAREGYDFQIGRVNGNGQDAHGVGVEAALLPPLDRNNGRARLQQFETQSALETKPDRMVPPSPTGIKHIHH